MPEGGAPVTGISVRVEGTPESSPLPPTRWGHRGKMSPTTQEVALTRPCTHGGLDLGLPAAAL